MPAPLSIVIPTLNSADVLPATLGALATAISSGLIRELIISDGGSTDATAAIAEEVGATLVRGSAGRGAQLRRGVARAGGSWIMILHADTHIDEGWEVAVSDHIRVSDRAGYGRLRFRSRGLPAILVAAWANIRSRLFSLPYGDQGLLISRQLYDEIGGYRDIPLMEDVAIARRLRGRLVPLGIIMRTSAERYARRGWVRQGARNLWTLFRYLAGVSPITLADEYTHGK